MDEIDGITLLLQPFFQEIGQLLFIFDNEDLHLSLFPGKGAPFPELRRGTRSAAQGEYLRTVFIVIPQVLENFNVAAEKGTRSWKTEVMTSRIPKEVFVENNYLMMARRYRSAGG
jgi:hypothetical protein